MKKEIFIKLCEWSGSKIRARVIGVEIFNYILEEMHDIDDYVVVFDFEGVESISSGFAKELFGRLKNHLNHEFHKVVRIKLSGPNDRIIKSMIFRGIGVL